MKKPKKRLKQKPISVKIPIQKRKTLIQSIKEEHLVKIIEKIEKKLIQKKTIEEKVKQTKTKLKKPKKKITIKDFYGKLSKTSYNTQSSDVYSQIKINPFVGFIYKSNIKENNELYTSENYQEARVSEANGEHNLASSQMMDNYAQKFTLNFLMGTTMNDISIEEKELMMFNLYDPCQKQIYLAKVCLLGFGHEKTMHAPIEEKTA